MFGTPFCRLADQSPGSLFGAPHGADGGGAGLEVRAVSRCSRCGGAIKPGEPAVHRDGKPVMHRSHFDRMALPRDRRQLLELVEEEVRLTRGEEPDPPASTGRLPDMEEIESMQYRREEIRRRSRR